MPGAKRPEREADCSSPSSVEVKYACSCPIRVLKEGGVHVIVGVTAVDEAHIAGRLSGGSCLPPAALRLDCPRHVIAWCLIRHSDKLSFTLYCTVLYYGGGGAEFPIVPSTRIIDGCIVHPDMLGPFKEAGLSQNHSDSDPVCLYRTCTLTYSWNDKNS